MKKIFIIFCLMITTFAPPKMVPRSEKTEESYTNKCEHAVIEFDRGSDQCMKDCPCCCLCCIPAKILFTVLCCCVTPFAWCADVVKGNKAKAKDAEKAEKNMQEILDMNATVNPLDTAMKNSPRAQHGDKDALFGGLTNVASGTKLARAVSAVDHSHPYSPLSSPKNPDKSKADTDNLEGLTSEAKMKKMLETLRSAIITYVQGVKTVPSHLWDNEILEAARKIVEGSITDGNLLVTVDRARNVKTEEYKNEVQKYPNHVVTVDSSADWTNILIEQIAKEYEERIKIMDPTSKSNFCAMISKMFITLQTIQGEKTTALKKCFSFVQTKASKEERAQALQNGTDAILKLWTSINETYQDNIMNYLVLKFCDDLEIISKQYEANHVKMWTKITKGATTFLLITGACLALYIAATYLLIHKPFPVKC